MIIDRLLRNVITQINLYFSPSEMSVWQYRILITFYMMVLQCSQWLRKWNITIYAMLAITMNWDFMMSYNSIWLYHLAKCFLVCMIFFLSTQSIIKNNLLQLKYPPTRHNLPLCHACAPHSTIATLTSAVNPYQCIIGKSSIEHFTLFC